MLISLSGKLDKNAFDKLVALIGSTHRDFMIQIEGHILLKDDS
jgi:hypothetical protein